MSSSINCNFVRCAVQHFMSTHMKGNLLQKGKMPDILRDYNRNFSSVHGLQMTYGIAAKRFQAICRIFNNKWHPQETKGAYLSVFSVEAWKVLSQEEREKHTLRESKACSEQFAALNDAFPTSVRRKKPIAVPKKSKSVTIELSNQDLSTPKALGRKVLKELNNISQERFHKSGEEVIIETPKSHLIRKPTSEELRKSKRKIEKNINDTIAQKKEEEASDIVLQNRLSWSTYDKLRKADTSVCRREGEGKRRVWEITTPSHRLRNDLHFPKVAVVGGIRIT